jgi:hypothetical protein
VIDWIHRANEVYGKSGIQFLFNPNPSNPRGPDWLTSSWNNDEINNHLVCGPDGTQAATDLANQKAGEFPSKVLAVFRSGGDGCGFSWFRDVTTGEITTKFVSMPGFYDTGGCGEQNLGQFAHELGHYMGLWHTFTELPRNPNVFTSIWEAERHLVNNNNNQATAFDADRYLVTDTDPDPMIIELGCHPPLVINLNGIEIDTTNIINNIMGYWRYPIKTTSLQQSLVAQGALEDRSLNTGLLIAKP